MSLKRSRLQDDIFSDNDEEKLEPKLETSEKPQEEEIQLTKKKRITRKQITESDMAGPDGIQRIYEVFPKVCQFHGRGNEVNYIRNSFAHLLDTVLQARDIKMLIRTYKEWSFQLFPTFAFEDVISKANKFGSKSALKTKLDDLRLTECQRYMHEVLGVSFQSASLPDDSDEVSANDTTIEDISPPRNLTGEGSIGEYCRIFS